MTLSRKSIFGISLNCGLLLAGLSVVLPTDRAYAADPMAVPASADKLPPVDLYVGHSILYKTPFPLKRLSVTDPKVADIQLLAPDQVLISGKANGATDLLMWGENEQASEASILVSVDRAALRIELNKLFPDSNIDVRDSSGVVIVTGVLQRASDVDALHRFLDAAVLRSQDAAADRQRMPDMRQDAGVLRYVDMTTLANLPQVQLKVILAETNRTAIRSLGINMSQSGGTALGGSQIGPDSGGALNPGMTLPAAAPFSANPAISLFGAVPKSQFLIFIQALAENQYLRVLAEPTLVAQSGEEASFLAGGEFPIPVAQGGGAGAGGGNSTTITVTYKTFGVQLHFRPTVLGDGKIQLHVAPESSELSSSAGAVQIQGFSIPGLLTRRAETTLRLNSGESFAMAGLISQDTQARSSRVPGLGDLPVLGSLFRSVRYQADDTELVVLVTASVVESGAMKHDPLIPGSLHVDPNDWDLYAMGRVEGRSAGKVSPADAEWLRDQGLNRLRGSGAWADYDVTPADASSDEQAK